MRTGRGRLSTRIGVLAAAGTLALSATGPAAVAVPAAGGEALIARVLHEAHAEASAEGVTGFVDDEVRVLRSERGRWAFGTVVLVAPPRAGSYPRDWLFVAERQDSGWRVGLDGQPSFAELSAVSPVVSAAEKRLFATHGGQASPVAPMVNGDYRTGMRLPWALNQSWSILGGPHAYDAGSGPWSSVDLAGGDQRVLAARGGVAYTPCVGMVRIIHPDGYASRYYHLWNHVWADGTSVAEGAFLGNTGTETGCGGAASARHVHFSLMYDGQFVPIANHIIGKWLFRDGSAQYGGSALHGSRSVPVGGAVTNYGVLGRAQGIVDANGGTTVNRRSGPGTNHPVVGSLADGVTIDVSCSANGTTHTGRWGATSLWDRLADGTWVSDAFVYTGIDGPVNGTC